jgi:hypothetical protein
MTPKMRRCVTALALALLAGCESNPEGPRAPSDAHLRASANRQGGAGQPVRKAVTKNPREIVNPD